MASDKSMVIRQLTLYSNGYGVFERHATVSGRGSIDLFFRDGEMQDVLQSLYFCHGSQDVGNISYESTKPQPSIVLSDDSPLVTLLQSLRGCHVAVSRQLMEDGKKSGVEELSGQVLGIDKKLLGGVNQEFHFVSLLLDGGIELRTMALSEVISIKMLQAGTQQDLQHALDQAQAEKRQDMQKLTIFYKDAAPERPLNIKYGVHVAEWKSSYRLVFLDGSGRFRLDGFAIVRNTQEEDWNDIGLTLVVGNPKTNHASYEQAAGAGGAAIKGKRDGAISLQVKPVGQETSFSVSIHPAQTVFDLKRQIQTLKGIPVIEQKIIFAGKECAEGRSLADYNMQTGSCLRLDRRATGRASANTEYETMMMKRRFVMAHQDGLSYYPIEMSVSAKRQQTAVVPLMKAELQGQVVTIYDDSIRKGNPLVAVLFENTTGRTLDQGTLQVMDEDRFLGEGSMPSLGKGDESAPIPFAVEMGVEVSISHVHKRHHSHEIKVSDGSIFLSYYRQQTTKYHIKNMTRRDMDFMLNHIFLDGWELYDHEEEAVQPVDVTDRVYQFRFDVSSAQEKEGSGLIPAEVVFPVREQVISVETTSIERMTKETLDALVKKGTIPDGHEVYASLLETIKVHERVDAFGRMVHEKEAELREVKETQTRLREHIRAIGTQDRESSKYTKSLAAEEDRLKKVEAEIKTLRNDKRAESRKHDNKVLGVHYTRKDIPAPPPAEEAKDKSSA